MTQHIRRLVCWHDLVQAAAGMLNTLRDCCRHLKRLLLMHVKRPNVRMKRAVECASTAARVAWSFLAAIGSSWNVSCGFILSGRASRLERYMSNHGSVMKLEYRFFSRSTISLWIFPPTPVTNSVMAFWVDTSSASDTSGVADLRYRCNKAIQPNHVTRQPKRSFWLHSCNISTSFEN